MTNTEIALLGITTAAILLNLLSALYKRYAFLREEAMRQHLRTRKNGAFAVLRPDVSNNSLPESESARVKSEDSKTE